MPEGGNSRCKGPEAGRNLVCLRKRKKVSVVSVAGESHQREAGTVSRRACRRMRIEVGRPVRRLLQQSRWTMMVAKIRPWAFISQLWPGHWNHMA